MQGGERCAQRKSRLYRHLREGRDDGYISIETSKVRLPPQFSLRGGINGDSV
jgi:hypothetical protein